MKSLLFLITAGSLLALPLPLAAQKVVVQPYVQPGDGSTLQGTDVKVIAWMTDQTPGKFTVEFGPKGGPMQTVTPTQVALDFKVATPPPATPKPATPAPTAEDLERAKLEDAATTLEEVKKEPAPVIPEKEQHYLKYAATLKELPFDSEIAYRVKLGETVVREASFKTRASADKPIRFIAVGDMAKGIDPRQNGVAYQMSLTKPDFLVALGDIVYPGGRMLQYMRHFWSTYNNVTTAAQETGAPMMQSVPFYVAVGNHDVESAKLPFYPDAYSAYYVFHPPLNGPGVGPWNTPLGNNAKVAEAFRKRAGSSYPALGHYSFDNGPAHFVILDSGAYTVSSIPAISKWLDADLKRSTARWKFVCFHVPAFQTSREHYTQQRMRLFQPIFEANGVDVVFAGHVHNYQRSKPLRFAPNDPTKIDKRGRVHGTFALDEKFDGVTNTRPNGVIHIVSGGGGASLYSPDLKKAADMMKKEHGANWTTFTTKYIADRHSFSLIDLTPDTFVLRQISITGEEVDKFTISKPAK